VAPDQLNLLDKVPMMEFAINSSILSTTGYVPFKVISGYMPQMIRQILEASMAPPGVKAFAVQALGNVAVAHDAIIASHVFQWHYTNLYCHEEPDIKPGGLVYLLTKNLLMPKGCAAKLIPKYVGLYKVV
jgi:hypothetical protein